MGNPPSLETGTSCRFRVSFGSSIPIPRRETLNIQGMKKTETIQPRTKNQQARIIGYGWRSERMGISATSMAGASQREGCVCIFHGRNSLSKPGFSLPVWAGSRLRLRNRQTANYTNRYTRIFGRGGDPQVTTPLELPRGAVSMPDLTQQILDLRQGDHLCLFYEADPAEQMPALVPFIQDALRQDERFIYIADDQTTEDLAARLEASGINVSHEIDQGRLKLWTRNEWRQPGTLNSDQKALQVRQLLQDSQAAGFKGTRFAVEMTWTLGPEIDARALEHWEATINTIFTPGTPGRIICQYNRSRLAPEALLAALHTHPLAILGDEVYPNLFYRAPFILSGGGNNKKNTAAKVDWIITQLKHAREEQRQHEAATHDTALKRTIVDLRRLHELSSRLAIADELDPALGEVLDTALSIHHTDRGLLLLKDPEDQGLTVRASAGFESEFLQLIHSQRDECNPRIACYQRSERVVVEDLETNAEFAGYREIARKGGIRAIHGTPLVSSKGQTIGVLAVYFSQPYHPVERETRLMDLLTRQAADAIESISLRDQLERELAARKQTERASQQLAAIVAHSNDAIFSMDLDGVITNWNSGAERLYGYAADEIIGQHITKLVPKVVHYEEPAILDQIRRGQLIEHYETVRQRKDGSLVDISLTVSPIKDRHGNIVGISKTARDISDKKRADETLRRQNRELEEIDIKKNEFLAMLSHELRNPLAAIQNAAELIGEETEESTRRWATGVVRRQIGSLARLVDDLVDVSRITSGRIELRRDNVDLCPILRRAVETVRPLIEERQHRIQLSIPDEALFISGDSARLEQLLVNLLTNSAKYTDPAGLIELTATRQHDKIAVAVKDNGIGIASDLLSHIFELFVQDKRGLDRSRGGLGIGLALAKRLTEMHEGTLSAASDGPGLGSVFTLILPALAVPSKLRNANPEIAVDSGNGNNRGAPTTRRILIVDDNKDSAHSVSRLLKRRGHEVRVVHDGLAALAIANHFEPDTFLLDLGLPGMDGYQLASELHRMGFNNALFVAISGYAQPQDIERSRAAGFHHHLAKPVDIERIKEVLAGAQPCTTDV